jgi:hypothetical protein
MKHLYKLLLGTLGVAWLVQHPAHAQLGVNLGSSTPQTALDVNGAITTRPVSVAVTGNAAAVPANAGQIVLTGSATADIVLTTTTPFAGQLLTVVNNTSGGQRALLNGIPISNGQALLFTGDAASGKFKSVDNGMATAAPALTAATNGLTAASGTVRLGGPLTAPTDVATAGNALTFSGTGKFGFGITTTTGLFNISGAMGSSTFTGGLNLTNTTGLTANNTLSIIPGYAGANSGLTTGTMATYDLPGAGNHVFGDHVIPDGNLNNLGNPQNRWATVYGTNGNFAGSLTANVSSPETSLTASATDYFVVTQNPITYRLPAVEANVGRTLIIYAFGGAATITTVSGTIYGPTAFTINSVTSYTLPQYHRITFICDGSNWISTAYL